MKILEASWKGHPILGDFDVKFCKADGTPYKTVVIAGENGTGKTAILRSLFKICDFADDSNIESITLLNESLNAPAKISHHYYTNTDTGITSIIGFDVEDETGNKVQANYGKRSNQAAIGSVPLDPRPDGSAFSSAQAVYEVKPTDSISASQLDTLDYKSKRNRDFTPQDLKQLLVDIKTQDDADYSNRGSSNPTAANQFANFQPHSRLFRFKYAFDNFFDHQLTFGGVKIIDGSHNPIFTKNGKEILLDKLSTGESQIVFRGGMLLANINKINRGVAFVDEPEISMHPRWQNKILKYYKDIFSVGGVQTGQLVVATHSEGVVAEAMKDPDTLVLVLRRRSDGKTVYADTLKPMVLDSPTAGETNYLAFDVISTDYHIALFAKIQALSGSGSITGVDNWIISRAAYDATRHAKHYSATDSHGHSHTAAALPTYIRNCIDHPDATHSYTEDELRRSVELMRAIIQNSTSPAPPPVGPLP